MTARITVVNMNDQAALFRNGYRPVVWTDSSPTWRPLSLPCEWKTVGNKTNDLMELTMRFQFEDGHDDAVSFAFCYPFSYEDSQAYLGKLTPDPTVYFHRKCLGISAGGRRIDMLTVTSAEGENAGCSSGHIEPCSDSCGSRLAQHRPVVFLSARVHPGESPASFIMNGFIDFILQTGDPIAVALRNLFLFKIVPMLNPDGVAAGNYRTDVMGNDLNRHYNSASSGLDIACVVREIGVLAETRRLQYYIDIHAHANKKGVFVYGNAVGDKQPETLLFARLMEMTTPTFSFEACRFSSKLMCARDRRGQSRSGSGRVSVFRQTGITHSYTLETNYCTDRGRTTVFTVDAFKDIGSALAKTLLAMASDHHDGGLPSGLADKGDAITFVDQHLSKIRKHGRALKRHTHPQRARN